MEDNLNDIKPYIKKKIINVTLNLPYLGEINGEWVPCEVEKEASWEIYILLISNMSFLKIKYEDDFIKKSASNLRFISTSLNEILNKYGISIYKSKIGKKQLSLGYIIVLIINHVIRPIVEKWYSILLRYEINIEFSNNNFDCTTNKKIINDLNNMIEIFNDLTTILAKAIDIPSVMYHF